MWRLPLIALFAGFAWGGACAADEPPGIRFTDVTAAAGIDFRHQFGDEHLSNIVEGTGSGATLFDYNGDGRLDLYLVNGRHRVDVNDNTGRPLRGKLRNALYRGNADGTFRDVTDEAGVTGGEGFGFASSAADYDADGDLDLYVCNYGPNILYRNNGDGTFTDVTEATGLGNLRWSLGGLWFDCDDDGDLDLFVANYLQYDAGAFRNFYAAAGYPGPLSYEGQPDALYRNDGDGHFTEITDAAGLGGLVGRAMSVTAADFLNSGALDLIVANDAMENYFFHRSAPGQFTDEALQLGLAFGEGGQGVSAMGPVFGDVDRDGRLDLYIPDMGYGCLQLNRGEFFEDRTNAAGLALICGQYTGWGAVLQDLDNDGHLDLYVANGDAHHEYGEEAVLVRNDGQGNFIDVSREAGPYFTEKSVARGATWGDYDNDGDVDLVVVHLNEAVRLLRNDTPRTNHWLTVEALDPAGKTPAIGARVTVTAGDLVQIDDLVPVRGYLSQGDPRCHFGLGQAASISRVEIRWPNRTTTTLDDVPADQILKVAQPRE